MRHTVMPDAVDNLQRPSQIEIDRVVSVDRRDIGQSVGRLDDATLLAVDRLLATFLGIGERRRIVLSRIAHSVLSLSDFTHVSGSRPIGFVPLLPATSLPLCRHLSEPAAETIWFARCAKLIMARPRSRTGAGQT